MTVFVSIIKRFQHVMCMMVLFFMCMVSSSNVQASTSMLSSQDIKTYCLSDYDIDVGYCAGYVTAVADLMVEHRIYGLEACYMELKSPQKMVQYVRAYIRKNPSIVQGNARFMIANILAQLYPCL